MNTQTLRAGARSRMSARLLQTAGWSAMLLALATPVWAQQQLTPPEHYTLDARGVDLVTGGFAYQTADVVIGDPSQGGLVHGRAYVNGGWRDTLSGTIGVSGTVYTVAWARNPKFSSSRARPSRPSPIAARRLFRQRLHF